MSASPSRTHRPSRFLQPAFPFKPWAGRLHYGWVIALCSTVGLICSTPGQTMGVGIFTDVLIENLHLNRTTVSTAYMVGTLFSGVLITSMGRWLDIYGLRLGGVLSGLGLGVALLYLSQVDRITHAIGYITPISWTVTVAFISVSLGFFLIRFFGQGLMTLASRNLISKWFDHHRGRVSSYCGVLASFAYAGAPWLLYQVVVAFGWRSAWVVLALGCGFLFAVTAWVFFRDNPEESDLATDAGMRPPEGDKINRDNIVVRDFSRAEALRTLSFWIFNLGFTYQGFFATGYVFHILSVADDIGVESNLLLSIFIPSAMLSIMVSLTAGWLIDRTRLKHIYFVFCLGMILFPLGLLLLPHLIGLPILILGMGLSGGCFAPILGTVWARFYGRTHLGAISGFNMSSLVIGSAMGPIVFSLSLDWFGSYQPCLWMGIFFGTVLLLSSYKAENPQRKLL